MNITYTTNELFVPKVAASICSVFENNKAAEKITVYIIGEGLSEESKAGYRILSKKYGREIKIIELNDLKQFFDFSFNTSGWSRIIVARLALDQLLPASVERVLYLDGDTVNVGSLEKLWHTDLHGAVLGACIEATVNRKKCRALGMTDIPYINSGVLLFDLKKWREQKTGEKVLGYYKRNNGKLISCDQDAINGALKGEIYYLSPKYNSYNIYWAYPYRILKKLMGRKYYYTQDQVKSAKYSPVIIHYLGEERPWRKGNRHKYRKKYRQYLRETPWRNEQPETGWELYFFFWNIFNVLIKPFPMIRYRIIDGLIPFMMKWRSKKLKAK